VGWFGGGVWGVAGELVWARLSIPLETDRVLGLHTHTHTHTHTHHGQSRQSVSPLACFLAACLEVGASGEQVPQDD
jgi:hypothetical protein